MQCFVQGETKIMVATTVIEVGVNIPTCKDPQTKSLILIKKISNHQKKSYGKNITCPGNNNPFYQIKDTSKYTKYNQIS